MFADNIKLVIISPASVLRSYIHRHIDRLEQRANPDFNNPTKKNGKEKSSEQYKLGKAKTRGSSVHKNLGTLAGSELSTGQLCTVQIEDPQHPWLRE